MAKGKPKAKKSIRLKDLVAGMNNGDFVLPEIQREFVWDLDRIADLWDSIYRGYPIGQLLFWRANTNLPMYSFLDAENEDNYLFVNKKPEWTHGTLVDGAGKTIVLDGQQRLTSLFLGLYEDGVACKSRRNVKDATRKYLCVYVGKEKRENMFQWREEEGEDYIKVIKAAYGGKRGNAAKLRERLEKAEFAVPVDYVSSNSVEEVVKIFQRLNTNGRNMSNSEIFLAMWFGMDKMGTLRKKLVDLKQAFGDDFGVKDSTITQLLLFVFGDTEKKESANKVSGISRETFERISEGMPRLIEAAKATVEFLKGDCGIYSNGEMTSHNLFIPIVALFYKFNGGLPDKLKAELRCFVYRALVFELFSKSTDELLGLLKTAINDLAGKTNPSLIEQFLNSKNERIAETCFGDLKDRDPEWLDGKINDLLKIQKGSKTNLILLLLRRKPANVDGEFFDQDHLFAAKLFGKNIEKTLFEDDKGKYGVKIEKDGNVIRRLSEEEAKEWGMIATRHRNTTDYRDGGEYNTLPNLWLLDSLKNREKGKKLLDLWFTDKMDEIEDPAERKRFMNEFREDAFLEKMNNAEYLKLTNFETVFEDRKETLKKELRKLLKKV
ncbi:DUF262 domain-containing protein [Candidatus Saccharibacteria bacterium]|nr:DUF262 domain-containing protein [Candidatus Saccharibacteria bacterium]